MRVCYNCGDPGHLRPICPKLGQQTRKRANESLPLPPPLKRQALMPRFYSIFEESIEPSTSHPITAAGGQVMMTYGIVRNISVMIGGLDMPADLKIFQVKAHDVILGMDWLDKYMAYLDCHRGRVLFETAKGMLGREAYLALITTVEVGLDDELKDIPVVREFKDVFRALTGLPPTRLDSFTIELEPETTPISKAPYWMSPAEMAELKKQLSELMEK
ncbi:PREDICTED: uncharacterized protein LOC109131224 [Camelina sativa]|uniref:Uncharacterized protein LOC109131224 n=1 Tax=Camelina sativa TaxID=90675 RepID=A0ABM1REM4_CAMSA|nr:PREDICTED: uncharacterized protein LOC109131224 [Camelina sativa]